MPRQLRIEYPGDIYQLMNGGDRREDIFVDDVHRHDFRKTLAEACKKTGSHIHAYCLMQNRFHCIQAHRKAPTPPTCPDEPAANGSWR